MNIGVCFLTTELKSQNSIVNFIKNSLNNVLNIKNFYKQYHLYTLFETNNINSIEDNIIPFNFKQLREKYNIKHKYIQNFRGVCHLPLFYLYDLHPEYDYYIFYEDDLLYTNFLFENNINPFNNIPFEYYDITFTYNRIFNPNWYWVKNVSYNLPKEWTPYEGLLNCYIISNKALKDLKEFCCNGKWYGHHELMVNSFFYNQQDKYKIDLIKNHIPCNIHWLDSKLYQDLFFKELSEYCFVHPIKNDKMLNYVKRKYNNHIT